MDPRCWLFLLLLRNVLLRNTGTFSSCLGTEVWLPAEKCATLAVGDINFGQPAFVE
jgi:hypothetical protein